jgi:hypothetical protein
MVVSIALLGFGAAGSILTAQRQGLRSGVPVGTLAVLAIVYGMSVILAFCILTRIPIDSLSIWREKSNLVALIAIYAVTSVPFLLAGALVGLALTRLATHVSRLYFADLLGSAVGGACSVWLLARVGSVATVILAGAVGCTAGFVFALAAGRASSLATLPPIVVAWVAFAAFAGAPALGWISVSNWHVPFASGKEFSRIPHPREVIRVPDPTAEVEVGPSVTSLPIMGGDFGALDIRAVTARLVGQDGSAPTMLFENASDLSAFPFLKSSQAATPYVAFGARGGSAPRVLVVGVGGGVDIMIALAHGATHVTGVEINRAMIKLLTDRFADYLSGLFHPEGHPLSRRIDLIHSEGRSFARTRQDRYDVIQLSGVDSFTALNTGAYTLSESYLYTTDAVKDLYDRLRDGGYLSYSRFVMTPPKKPRETLRLANIAFTALRELGVSDPASHLIVFQGREWASTIIKRGAFGQREVDALNRFADEQRFRGLLFDPLRDLSDSLPRIDGERTSAFHKNQLRFAKLLRFSDSQRRNFVDRYEYDLTPSTDDRPFFFNYYRYAGLFRRDRADRGSPKDVYHPDYPVGHFVLIVSLIQITVLSALLILAPLRRLPRTREAGSRKLSVFSYFASLGMGFMFVEIALMQKTILFLGHPTYAVSVVLTTLLASAGLGSFLTGYFQLRRRTLICVVLAIVILVTGNALALDALLPKVLTPGLSSRVLLVVCAIAPLGIALGMPFPLGMRVVRESCPELLPWAWAINGFVSVFASIFCVILSMAIGFLAVFLISAAVYALGIAPMIVGLPEAR